LLIYAGKSGFRVTFIPVFYLIFTAVASLFSLPFGKLADRIGRKPLLFFSFVCWGLVCAVVIYWPGKIAVFIIFILYGLHKGALEPVQKTMVAELSPESYRASTLGGFQMVVGLCALPASLISGILWDKLGMAIPFVFSLAVTVLASILLLAVKER
jgi:MFS family permease